MKLDCIIGIDPGKTNGGIARYIPGRDVEVLKMPKKESELIPYLEALKQHHNVLVVIEKVQLRDDDIGTGREFRMQALFANFQKIIGVCDTVGLPYVLVHPMTWQTRLKLRTTSRKRSFVKETPEAKNKRLYKEKQERKKFYKEAAQELYKEIRVTLWSSDALLIMHFMRFMLANDIQWVKNNLPATTHQKIF